MSFFFANHMSSEALVILASEIIYSSWSWAMVGDDLFNIDEFLQFRAVKNGYQRTLSMMVSETIWPYDRMNSWGFEHDHDDQNHGNL